MSPRFTPLVLLFAVLASLALPATPAGACEKHLHGHQGSSDSQSEGVNR